MGDDISLKILDTILKKCTASKFQDKENNGCPLNENLCQDLDKCKENLEKSSEIKSEVIENSKFIKSLSQIAAPKPKVTWDSSIPLQDSPNCTETPKICLIEPVNIQEHETIPLYMRRPLNCSDLNAMILKLEEAYEKRNKLLTSNFHKLSTQQKNVQLQIKEEMDGLKLSPETKCVSEDEWKKCLDINLQAKLKWATQQLRHLRRIKEARFRQKVYYIIL